MGCKLVIEAESCPTGMLLSSEVFFAGICSSAGPCAGFEASSQYEDWLPDSSGGDPSERAPLDDFKRGG